MSQPTMVCCSGWRIRRSERISQHLKQQCHVAALQHYVATCYSTMRRQVLGRVTDDPRRESRRTGTASSSVGILAFGSGGSPASEQTVVDPNSGKDCNPFASQALDLGKCFPKRR